MSALIDALLGLGSGVLDTLDMPGSYLRGALAGRLGERLSGREMLNEWGVTSEENDPNKWFEAGDLAGFGAEIVADPVNLLGGLAAKALRKSALHRGPQYPGGIEKLKSATPDVEENFMEGYVSHLSKKPELSDVLSEVPEGSTFLGHGTEGFALKTPQGDVLRIDSPLHRNRQPMLRPDVPEMLQPTRAVRYGDHIVERLPLARVPSEGTPDYESMMQGLLDRLKQSNTKPVDLTSGNVGLLDDMPVAIDPGALAVPMREISETQTSPLMNALLNSMGYTNWARRKIEGKRGLPDPLTNALLAYNTAQGGY